MRKFELIGLMSGTSLDGLDIAHVLFHFHDDGSDSFELLHSKTYDLPSDLALKLSEATNYSVTSLSMLDKEFGKFMANCVTNFIDSHSISKSTIQAIASHGQTIFHQPHNGFTLQIGCGSTLSFYTGIPVINDFRTKDIIAGGQGAPLVPIGDFGLFNTYAESFLNIGGFSNLSYKNSNGITAFDICPGNLPLNKLAMSKGLSFDKGGNLAKSGEINFFLLDLLNSLPYYQTEGPKSLGTEWLEAQFYPLLKFDKEIENNLRTVVEHIAYQIGHQLNNSGKQTVCITGGGARNAFLISRIEHYYKGNVIIPETTLVDFKEALVFAYLGALYLANRPNSLASVTGAHKDSVCGVLHIP